MKVILSTRVILPQDTDLQDTSIENRRKIIHTIATTRQNKNVAIFYTSYLIFIFLISGFQIGSFSYLFTVNKDENLILYIVTASLIPLLLYNYSDVRFVGSGLMYGSSKEYKIRWLWTMQPSATYFLAKYTHMKDEDVNMFFKKLLYCKYHIKFSDKLIFKEEDDMKKKWEFKTMFRCLFTFNLMVKIQCLLVLPLFLTYIFINYIL